MSKKVSDESCEPHHPPLHTLPGLHFTTLPGDPTLNPYHLHPHLLAGGYREESDSLGKIDVPSHALWGASTQRALEHLPVNLPEDRLPYKVVVAVAAVKRAVAVVCGEGRVGETDCWSYEHSANAREGVQGQADAAEDVMDGLQRGICPPMTHTGAACGADGQSESQRAGESDHAAEKSPKQSSPAHTETTAPKHGSSGVLSPLKALAIALAAEEVMSARAKLHSWVAGVDAAQMRRDLLSGAVLVSKALRKVHRDSVPDVEGDLRLHFPLSVWQTGSGTHTNMNVNEVVAKRATAIAAQLGLVEPASAETTAALPLHIHPNDDVNICQSSNDVMPTAIYLAAAVDARRLAELCRRMSSALETHARNTRTVIKLGRTHLRDATPIPLSTELACFVEATARAAAQLDRCVVELCEVPLGGTAVGTGLNTYRGKSGEFAGLLRRSYLLKLLTRATPLITHQQASHQPQRRSWRTSPACLCARCRCQRMGFRCTHRW